MWQSVIRLLQALFYPPRCQECKKQVEGQALLCSGCRSKLQKKSYLHGEALLGKHLAGACLLYAYSGGVKQTMHAVKYLQRKNLLPKLATEVADNLTWQELTKAWSCPELTVVPIPTEPERKKQRGYDIPEAIFAPWCHKAQLPWQAALVRSRGVKPQYGLNKKDRRSNVAGSFQVIGQVKDKHILLVDDIYTTGATMTEAAKVLKQAGAKAVWALAFSGGAVQEHE